MGTERELVDAGEGSMQNIRKRARKAKGEEDAAAEALLELQGPGPGARSRRRRGPLSRPRSRLRRSNACCPWASGCGLTRLTPY